MENRIQFTDYDRITDILMYLSNTITLNFNVVLSRKDKFGKRSHFHYETEYQSKYNGVNIGRGIKRNMNFYFTLDNKNDFANGFIIRPQDVMLLNMIIDQQILPWFFGQKRIFSITKDGERLIVKGEFEPVNYTQSEYKYISFVPIVYNYEDGTFKEGIRIYVNSQSEYADLDIDRFMGFVYILKNTDMYAVACSMVTYVKQSPHGTNIFSMTGLGGGYVQDNWNESEDVSNSRNNNKGNNFLNTAKKKGN